MQDKYAKESMLEIAAEYEKNGVKAAAKMFCQHWGKARANSHSVGDMMLYSRKNLVSPEVWEILNKFWSDVEKVKIDSGDGIFDINRD